MAFEKGKSGNPTGRPKGATNHTTRELKEALLMAAELAGDVVGASIGQSGTTGYLMWLAINHQTTFGSLLNKAMPTVNSGDPENPLEVIHKIERLIVDAATTDS